MSQRKQDSITPTHFASMCGHGKPISRNSDLPGFSRRFSSSTHGPIEIEKPRKPGEIYRTLESEDIYSFQYVSLVCSCFYLAGTTMPSLYLVAARGHSKRTHFRIAFFFTIADSEFKCRVSESVFAFLFSSITRDSCPKIRTYLNFSLKFKKQKGK